MVQHQLVCSQYEQGGGSFQILDPKVQCVVLGKKF